MRTTLKQTIASAWMLLAALAIGTASCSQSEDTPDAPSVATGNEPISISIAPKPGFEAGDAQTRSIIQAEAQTRSNDAQTRSTVDDATGTFTWEEGDDMRTIFTFDDAAATVQAYKWIKNSTITAPVAGWKIISVWQGGPEVFTMTWPVGAKTCKVQAFYTNCKASTNGYGYSSMEYGNGMGDHMIFNGTFSVGEELKINFAHQTTRVTFKGLKAGTTYTLKLNDDADQLPMPTSFKKEGFAFGDYAAQPFTTDKDGTFTRCLPLTSHINATSGEVKINLFADNGTTPITEGTLQAKGSIGAWKTDGLQYIMTAKDFAGGNNPDTAPDLLIPAPIVPGAKVHELNGYYITQPHATATQPYQWASTTSFTEMENDPCKGYGNWRMPTMKDFEVIAGWTVTNPYSEDKIGTNNATTISAASMTALSATSGTTLWSSERHSDISYAPHALALFMNSNNVASYGYNQKTSDGQVRCVQKK